ncbi:MAG: hypothetical protein O2887_09940 [Bacteroidetes bacterium]|nr:hypothetical protein [Bacteroidota bacterium]MDA1120792.1 hypothetical protein [Bacteroidota bacterium]
MKTKFIVFALGTLFTINSSFGQSKGDFRPSLGLVFGTKAGIDEGGEKGQIGITPGIEYLFANSIGANVSYDYYFESKVEGSGSDLSIQFGSLNIDGRYYFVPAIYGLVGIAFL